MSEINLIPAASLKFPVKFRDSFIERMKWRLFYWFYKKQIQIILDEMNAEMRGIYFNRRADGKGE